MRAARACGVPVIVPDRGGAAAHAQGGGGVTFRANDSADLTAAIKSVLSARKRTCVPARTMIEHFEDLFGLYATSGAMKRIAA